MHISFILAIIGIVGYFLNLTIIDYFVKVKAFQMQEESKVERRRSSESRNVKSKVDKRLMKEVPKLKWTVWFGSSMFVIGAIGFVWSLIYAISSLFKK